MRTCNVCNTEKPFDDFHRAKSLPDGRCYTCKLCSRERTRQWNKKNQSKKRLSSTKHYRENREVYKEYSKEATWRKRNRDHINRKARLRYHQTNGAAKTAFYRHKRRQAVPKWLSDSQKEQIENFYWLVKDLKATTGETYHVDHIVPIHGKNVCGLHVPWNLQVLPSDLNIKKGNKLGTLGY